MLLKETSQVAILSREAWLVCRGLRERRRGEGRRGEEERRREEEGRRGGEEMRGERRGEEATSFHRELATGGEYSAVGGKGRSQMGRKNNRVGYIYQENQPKR